jgi:hypothetical protein
MGCPTDAFADNVPDEYGRAVSRPSFERLDLFDRLLLQDAPNVSAATAAPAVVQNLRLLIWRTLSFIVQKRKFGHASLRRHPEKERLRMPARHVFTVLLLRPHQLHYHPFQKTLHARQNHLPVSKVDRQFGVEILDCSDIPSPSRRNHKWRRMMRTLKIPPLGSHCIHRPH